MRQSGIRIGLAVLLGLALLPDLAAAASPSPVASGDHDAAVALAELMNAVPAGIRETCGPSTMELLGVVTSTSCIDGEGVAIYARFDSPASLHAGYDFIAVLTDVAPDTGTGCGDGAYEGEYLGPDGSPAGRLLCVIAPEGPTALWIDADHEVLGLVQLPDGTDYQVLEAAWQAARLEPGTEVDGAATGPISQWASAAVASTQYGTDSFSAMQATGLPDTTAYGDQRTAWAPSRPDDGEQWMELTYETPVVPLEVVVWETNNNGFLTRVEAYDEASDTWLTLWRGIDDSPNEVHGFSPTLLDAEMPTTRLRLTIDTDVPDYNAIDAVELIGMPASPAPLASPAP